MSHNRNVTRAGRTKKQKFCRNSVFWACQTTNEGHPEK